MNLTATEIRPRRSREHRSGPTQRSSFNVILFRCGFLLGFGVLLLRQGAAAEIPDGTNFFGDQIVRKIPKSEAAAEASSEPVTPAIPEGYRQTLIFQDGSQLRGELISMEKGEIIWRRPELSDLLRIRREAVRRIVLAVGPDTHIPGPFELPPATDPIRATVKMAGADWLYGDVTSADGAAFAVKLDEERSISLSRANIDWIYFDRRPAPVLSISATTGELQGGWYGFGEPAIHFEDGMMVSELTFNRAISNLPRLEVDLDLPGSEDGVQVVFSGEGHAYTIGAVGFGLGPFELEYDKFVGKMETTKTPHAADFEGDSEIVRYQFFYDWTGYRVTVLCNGRQLGEYRLPEKKEGPPAAFNLDGHRFFDLWRIVEKKETPFSFSRLRVAPWNGQKPAEAEPHPAEERLSSAGDATVSGRVESLTKTNLAFSGAEKIIGAETFLEFAERPRALADPEALLRLGSRGEINAADLRMSDGRIRGRTAFSSDLELPVGAVTDILLARKTPAPQGAATDLLVFNDGGELAGTLLDIGPNQPVRWMTSSGQKIEVSRKAVAGIRFIRAAPPASDPSLSEMELRNGDELYGRLLGLDEKKVQIAHPLWGSATLNRDWLARVYPSANLIKFDGGREIGTIAQTGTPTAFKNREFYRNQIRENLWLYLDGSLSPRKPQGSSMTLRHAGEVGVDNSLPESFEFHADCTNLAGGCPIFEVEIFAPENRAMTIYCGFGQISLFGFDPEVSRTSRRVVSIGDKIPEPASRLGLSVLVNAKSGIVDVICDGVSIAQTTVTKRLSDLGQKIGLFVGKGNVISNLWLGPAGDETFTTGGKARTTLANGDVVIGNVHELRDGKLSVESTAGALDLPLQSLRSVILGLAEPRRTGARIRLPDGSALNVESPRYEDGVLTAHSEPLGDLTFPAGTVSELILDPAISRPPHSVASAAPDETAVRPEKLSPTP